MNLLHSQCSAICFFGPVDIETILKIFGKFLIPDFRGNYIFCSSKLYFVTKCHDCLFIVLFSTTTLSYLPVTFLGLAALRFYNLWVLLASHALVYMWAFSSAGILLYGFVGFRFPLYRCICSWAFYSLCGALVPCHNIQLQSQEILLLLDSLYVCYFFRRH